MRACLDQQDLQLLVQCCPGLRDLQLGAAVGQHADFSPLVQLQQLTALAVCLDLDDKTAQDLAVLTGLRRLDMNAACLPAVALERLTKLQDLDVLHISAGLRSDGFYKISEELLKHPEANQRGLHLETRSVSCQVQC
jgi:hypothetical protein